MTILGKGVRCRVLLKTWLQETIILCSPSQPPQHFSLSFRLWWQQSLPSPWLCLPTQSFPPSFLLSDTFFCLCHPPHFLAPSLSSSSEFFLKSLSLKGRLQLPQTSPKAFCCSFFISLFSCFYSIYCVLWTAIAIHTHTQNGTHKTHCSTARWMTGWECQILCYFMRANSLWSCGTNQRAPWGTGAFSEMQTIIQANCFVISLCLKASITGNLCEPAHTHTQWI